MAIEGLMVKQAVSEPPLFRERVIGAVEAAGVTLEAYKLLGYAGDPAAAEYALEEALNPLANLGYDGRLYVHPPKVVGFAALIAAAEGKKPEGIEEAFIYPNLWVHGTEKESYTQEDLDEAPAVEGARLALFNPDMDTGVDPMLHHLGIPYDDYAKDRWGGDTTQLAEVEKDKSVFEAKHPELTLGMVDHRDFALLALMDRIRGVDPQASNYIDPRSENFVLNTGFMRVAGALGRRSVGGVSCVGGVYSGGGRLDLGRSLGDAGSYDGVGLSVGPKELDPQAS
jgi:hypothetical protein